MISEKKYSVDCFRGKKYPALKKIYLSWRIILKEISYTIECQVKNYISRDLGKKILIQAKTPLPPPFKSQMVEPSRENRGSVNRLLLPRDVREAKRLHCICGVAVERK